MHGQNQERGFMAAIKISENDGEKISNLDLSGEIEINGVKYQLIDRLDNYENYKWCNTTQFILRTENDSLYQMLYDYGSTENQESGFIYNTPELTEVTQEIIETYIYKVHNG